MQDGIVLLHGIFRTRRSMRRLARHLEKQGYRVLNLGYPSTRLPLEKLADFIHPFIETFTLSVPGSVHFVGYSMGGLLIRAYVHKHRPARLGRVVMVGTPNGGSEVADALKGRWLYRACYGPAGQQLGTAQDGIRELLGTVDYELGIIAGDRSIDPISSWLIGRPNDGKVSVESTRLDGMKAHIVIPMNHTFFPDSRRMWRHAEQFLRTGGF